MQRLLVLSVILFLSLAGALAAQDANPAPRLESDRDSLSYAVGLDVARNDLPRVHADSLRGRLGLFLAGVREGAAGTDVPNDSVARFLAGSLNRGSFASDSLSHAAGIVLMRLLRNARAGSGIDVDPEILIAGIRDGWNNAPRIDARIQRLLMSAANDRAAESRMKHDAFRRDSLYMFNVPASRAFMAKHARGSHVVTIDDDVHYEVISLGSGGSPKEGDRVTVRYRGTLLDGRGFVDTRDGSGSPHVQVGDATPGIGPVLLRMTPGERCRVTTILPRGSAAYWNGVPPGAVLQFDLELVAVDNGGK
ncbi:MAG TPA: FKBP-type peptidyl-prolyl cis-trans isomerase [Candidatus Kapabacteria bacterium]|nr:FKBP-type peptidyl-prolyl cis-trans isomerase [Candidatus Kapabacteria bacterium]